MAPQFFSELELFYFLLAVILGQYFLDENSFLYNCILFL